MVFFSSRISPRTSTVILRDKSPFGDGRGHGRDVATWLVRFDAIEFTDSVKSFHTPATPRTQRLAAQLSFGADFAGDARHFGGEPVELVHHDVDGVLQLEDFAAHVHRDFAGQVAVRDGGGHFGDVSHLVGQVDRPSSSPIP